MSFPFNEGDTVECVRGDTLIRGGQVSTVHRASQPSDTLYQWVYVDVGNGVREWVPASHFRALS